jgi:hypothetical protein
MDSALARALSAARSEGADTHIHGLLAKVAVLRLWNETRLAMEGVLSMAFEGDERGQELARVRAYLGDPQTTIVPLQRELAGIVAEHSGYPL